MQSLIDKDEIRDLVLRYSRAVDRQDFVLLRSLYADDAVDEHEGLYSGGIDGYIDWLKQVMPRLAITAHLVHNHLIAIENADRAQGEVYAVNYHRMPAENGEWRELVMGARYLDRYAKIGGHWRFGRRTVAIDWKQEGPSVWSVNDPALANRPLGTHDSSDPSYRLLSAELFARR